MARSINDDDVVEGIVLLRKGAEADATLDALHEKIAELNDASCPPGVKIVPASGPQRPGPLHHPHRLAQPDRRQFCWSR